MKYKLASSSWDQSELNALQDVIDSNFFTMGARTKVFEQEFSLYNEVKYSVMVNSGSSANLLMVAALMFSKKYDIKEGDEVIAPAVSWATTFFPFHQHKLVIKFVDVDISTFNISVNEVLKAITEKTKIICAVNLLGNSCDFEKLLDVCKSKNIILIEDNCESLGATLNGKKTGSFGLISTHSFFFSHHISTMEGGMVCTNDEEIYHILLSLRAHGWTRNLPDINLVTNKKNSNNFYEMFNFVLPGYNLRPIEFEAAVGIEQLKKLPSIINMRRKNAIYFQQIFDDSTVFNLQAEVGESSWFGFGVILKDPTKRDFYIEKLVLHDIECRPIVAGNFTRNSVINYLNHSISGELINSDKIHDCGLFFGNSHEDLKNEIDFLSEIL